MSTMDSWIHPLRTAGSLVDFFSVWDATRIPHLAVVGRIGDGRAAVVDRIIEYFTTRQATTVMIYPALNPQLAPVTTLVKGALEAEGVLQHYLEELHHRYTAIERGSTISLTPILIVVDALDELLATTTHQQRIHRLQLDLEAIAILGKNVGLHLVCSPVTSFPTSRSRPAVTSARSPSRPSMMLGARSRWGSGGSPPLGRRRRSPFCWIPAAGEARTGRALPG